MSKLKQMLIRFDISNTEEINEVFTLLCKYLGLNKKKEQDLCFPNGSKVDVMILVKLAMRYGLLTELDFTTISPDNGVIHFVPVTTDIKDVDEVNEEEEAKDSIRVKKDLEEIKKAKAKSTPVAPPPKKVVDDFDDFDDL